MATLKCLVARFSTTKSQRCVFSARERGCGVSRGALQVELAGKHIIVNASERKMNVKFSRFVASSHVCTLSNSAKICLDRSVSHAFLQ